MKNLFWALLISLLHCKVFGLSTGGYFAIHAADLRRGGSFFRMASIRLRGGESEVQVPADEISPVEETEPRTSSPMRLGVAGPWFSAVASLFGSVGKFYSSQLDLRPIITKSWTAGFIFALSDYLAQWIEIERRVLV